MENKAAVNIDTVIDYIENHISEKIDLETVAAAANYSKYHLHRMFTETVGLTIHDYIHRRQLLRSTVTGKRFILCSCDLDYITGG